MSGCHFADPPVDPRQMVDRQTGLARDECRKRNMQLGVQAKARCDALQPDDLLAHGQSGEQLRPMQRLRLVRQDIKRLKDARFPCRGA